MSWSTKLHGVFSDRDIVTEKITYPSFARSQTKFFKSWSEKPCDAQLKLGLRLYTSHLKQTCSVLYSSTKCSRKADNSLARVLLADLPSERAGLLKIRLLGLEPEQVGIGSVGLDALDRRFHAASEMVVTLPRSGH
jgi:hypothetical protein